MSTKPFPSDLPVKSFSSASEFEAFLEREGTTAPGIYLKLAKKSCSIPSISGAEAVESSLCYGWIDGRANRFDDQWWTIRLTPRRPKSIWSQKNVATVGRLLEEGRMQPAGIAAVEAAKADGRWERAYAGSATIEVPEDLAVALAAEPAAAAFFEGMTRSDRYATLWRVQIASPQGRAKKIESIVQMLVNGETPGRPEKKPAVKPKKNADVKIVKTKRAAAKPDSARKKLAGLQSLQDDQPARPRRIGLRPRP